MQCPSSAGATHRLTESLAWDCSMRSGRRRRKKTTDAPGACGSARAGRQPTVDHAMATLRRDGDARPLREPCTQRLGPSSAGEQYKHGCELPVRIVLQPWLQTAMRLDGGPDTASEYCASSEAPNITLSSTEQLMKTRKNLDLVHFSRSCCRGWTSCGISTFTWRRCWGNIAGARQIFERWMKWEPDHHGWTAYIKALRSFSRCCTCFLLL